MIFSKFIETRIIFLVSFFILIFFLNSSYANNNSKHWLFLKDNFNISDLNNSKIISDFVVESGGKIRITSKWLNAISVSANDSILFILKNHYSIKNSKIVAKLRKNIPDLKPSTLSKQNLFNDFANNSFFGRSYNHLLNISFIDSLDNCLIDPKHSGRGLRIAILDAGFDIDHYVFNHFHDSSILAQRDYVAGMIDTSIVFDSIVKHQNNESYKHDSHGTAVLSLFAAYSPYELIGIVPQASFILCKTEYIEEEIIAEEDSWISAIEWAVDTMKAQIVNSSLGYRDEFTDEREDYPFSNFDGSSLLISIVADTAFAHGALVVVSVGNEGKDTSSICDYRNNINCPNTLVAPSDSKFTLSVGAINPITNSVASFSSCGPTFDGRVKPEVVAPGEYISVASVYNNSYGISSSSGTSFSSPIVAACASIILSKNPTILPSSIRDTIISNAIALNATSIPDSIWGYGKISLSNYKLVSFQKEVFINKPNIVIAPLPIIRGKNVSFSTTLLETGDFYISIYTASGSLIERLVTENKNSKELIWKNSGNFATGVYYCKIKFVTSTSISYSWLKKIVIVY